MKKCRESTKLSATEVRFTESRRTGWHLIGFRKGTDSFDSLSHNCLLPALRDPTMFASGVGTLPEELCSEDDDGFDPTAQIMGAEIINCEDTVVECIESGQFNDVREADDIDRMMDSHLATEKAVENGAFDLDDQMSKAEMATHYEQMAADITNKMQTAIERAIDRITPPVRRTISSRKAVHKECGQTLSFECRKGPGCGWKTGLPFQGGKKRNNSLRGFDGKLFSGEPGEASRGSYSATYHRVQASRRRPSHQWERNKHPHARHNEPANILVIG